MVNQLTKKIKHQNNKAIDQWDLIIMEHHVHESEKSKGRITYL